MMHASALRVYHSPAGTGGVSLPAGFNDTVKQAFGRGSFLEAVVLATHAVVLHKPHMWTATKRPLAVGSVSDDVATAYGTWVPNPFVRQSLLQMLRKEGMPRLCATPASQPSLSAETAAADDDLADDRTSLLRCRRSNLPAADILSKDDAMS